MWNCVDGRPEVPLSDAHRSAEEAPSLGGMERRL